MAKKIGTTLRMGAFVAVALAMSGCVTTTQTPTVAASAPVVATSGFGGLLNQQRGAQGTALVGQDATLVAAARSHAADMVAKGYFSHTGANGSSVATRIRAAGGCRAAVAENIAQGQSSETAVFEGWMNSASHRSNMLNQRYNKYGLGRSGNTWVLVLSGPCI